jgi:hypothetical protein
MGNCSSNAITIDLDRTNSFYLTGETVSGTAGLHITNGKVEADEIYIQLTGEIGYITHNYVRNARGEMENEAQYNHVPFYSAKVTFAQPEAGQKELVYSQGQYSWPFKFLLIHHLPPTINQPNLYPHVRYHLKVVIDKPWYKPNTTETKRLTISPRVNLLQNPQCLQAIPFEHHNRKEITLTGKLDKSGYVPGEIIHITLEIENPRNIIIQHIDVTMLQSYRIGQTSRGYTVFQTVLPNIINLKDQLIRETSSIQIPSVPIPPSYQFQGGIEKPATANINYILKIAAKVHGIYTNFDIEIPITLGTEPDPDPSHQQTFKPLVVPYSSNPEQSMFTNHDVVQNTT